MNELTSGSVNGWLQTHFLGKLTGFTSLGAGRVVLSWNVETKLVTMINVDADNKLLNTLFTVAAKDIQQATFFYNNFYIKIGGVKYDISLRNARANRAGLNDIINLVDSEIGGILEINDDIKSGIDNLRAFLQSENEKNTFVLKTTPRTRIKLLIIVAVAVVAIAVIVLVVSIVAEILQR